MHVCTSDRVIFESCTTAPLGVMPELCVTIFTPYSGVLRTMYENLAYTSFVTPSLVSANL